MEAEIRRAFNWGRRVLPALSEMDVPQYCSRGKRPGERASKQEWHLLSGKAEDNVDDLCFGEVMTREQWTAALKWDVELEFSTPSYPRTPEKNLTFFGFLQPYEVALTVKLGDTPQEPKYAPIPKFEFSGAGNAIRLLDAFNAKFETKLKCADFKPETTKAIIQEMVKAVEETRSSIPKMVVTAEDRQKYATNLSLCGDGQALLNRFKTHVHELAAKEVKEHEALVDGIARRNATLKADFDVLANVHRMQLSDRVKVIEGVQKAVRAYMRVGGRRRRGIALGALGTRGPPESDSKRMRFRADDDDDDERDDHEDGYDDYDDVVEISEPEMELFDPGEVEALPSVAEAHVIDPGSPLEFTVNDLVAVYPVEEEESAGSVSTPDTVRLEPEEDDDDNTMPDSEVEYDENRREEEEEEEEASYDSDEEALLLGAR